MFQRITAPNSTAITAGAWGINLLQVVPIFSPLQPGIRPKAVSGDSFESDALSHSFGRIASNSHSSAAPIFADAAKASDTNEALEAALADDLDPDAQPMAWMTSMTLLSSLLLIGLFTFRGIFSRRSSKAPAPMPDDAGFVDRETLLSRDTIPAAEAADRPTVAETPRALGQRPSHGVKIGGESTPGMSIMPPPNSGYKGGNGII